MENISNKNYLESLLENFTIKLFGNDQNIQRLYSINIFNCFLNVQNFIVGRQSPIF